MNGDDCIALCYLVYIAVFCWFCGVRRGAYSAHHLVETKQTMQYLAREWDLPTWRSRLFVGIGVTMCLYTLVIPILAVYVVVWGFIYLLHNIVLGYEFYFFVVAATLATGAFVVGHWQGWQLGDITLGLRVAVKRRLQRSLSIFRQ